MEHKQIEEDEGLDDDDKDDEEEEEEDEEEEEEKEEGATSLETERCKRAATRARSTRTLPSPNTALSLWARNQASDLAAATLTSAKTSPCLSLLLLLFNS